MPTITLVFGVIVTVLGIIFTAQGQGILGPSQSFMVNNPRWITYGSIMVIIGLLLMLASLFTSNNKLGKKRGTKTQKSK